MSSDTCVFHEENFANKRLRDWSERDRRGTLVVLTTDRVSLPPRATEGYTGPQKATQGYRGLHRATEGSNKPSPGNSRVQSKTQNLPTTQTGGP